MLNLESSKENPTKNILFYFLLKNQTQFFMLNLESSKENPTKNNLNF